MWWENMEQGDMRRLVRFLRERHGMRPVGSVRLVEDPDGVYLRLSPDEPLDRDTVTRLVRLSTACGEKVDDKLLRRIERAVRSDLPSEVETGRVIVDILICIDEGEGLGGFVYLCEMISMGEG